MTNRTRRGAALGAAAAACLLTVGGAPASAQAAPAAASAAAAHCGNPVLKVRGVTSLSGKIYCFKPKSKLVYSDSIAGKKAPAETAAKALPAKSKCKSFYAEGVIVYKGASRLQYKDTWRWNWGEYPA
jgi:hypothetical protein